MALFVGKNSIPGLENQLEKARAELSAAELAFAEAARSIENPPLELSDEQVSSLVDVRNGCEVRLVQAKVAFRRADAALNDASTAAAARERADALARVMSLGKAAQRVAREELTAATKGLRRAIRLMAEAEAAREELNTSLPPEQQIESFEGAVLSRPGIAEQVIKRERILKWVKSPANRCFRLRRRLCWSRTDAQGPRSSRQGREASTTTARSPPGAGCLNVQSGCLKCVLGCREA